MNNWTNQDVYQVMNELVHQTMGYSSELSVFDSSSFVSVGEKLKSLGQETIYNALTMMFSNTVFSNRPYGGKFKFITEDNRLWGNAVRKITYLTNDAIKTEGDNTNLNDKLGKKGVSVDPFEQIPGKVVETAFIGTNDISKGITTYTRTQLHTVFSSESEFAQFIAGQGVQWRNELEKLHETERRGTVLNYIGALYASNLSFDLAEGFNKEYGTAYTREELLTTYLQSFYAYITSTIDIISGFFTEYSVLNHLSIGGYDRIARHTPKDSQRMIFFDPFFKRAKRLVLADTFNPEYYSIGEYEAVNFWENEKNPESVSVKPNYINTAGDTVEGDAVTIPYVLGVLYDRDAIGWYKIDESTDVIYNPRGKYYSAWYLAQGKPWNDLTENGILFYIGEGGTPKSDITVTAMTGSVWGKSIADFQENIVVTNNKATGTLKYFEGWGSGTLADPGYFIALQFSNIPESATSVRVGMNPSTGTGLVELDEDKNGVFRVTSITQQELQIVYTVDGENHVQNIDLSGLTLVD